MPKIITLVVPKENAVQFVKCTKGRICQKFILVIRINTFYLLLP